MLLSLLLILYKKIRYEIIAFISNCTNYIEENCQMRIERLNIILSIFHIFTLHKQYLTINISSKNMKLLIFVTKCCLY